MVSAPGLQGKDSIFMGNIDEKKLSALLERIDNIKSELGALENEVRGLGDVLEPAEVPVDIPAEAPAEIPAEALVEAPVEAPVDIPEDTNDRKPDDQEEFPIEIGIPEIDITPIIEDHGIRPDDDLPADNDLPAVELSAAPEPDTEPMHEPTVDIEPEIAAKPILEPEPEQKAPILDSRKAGTAVMDVMAEKQAWRTDRPGSQVKNVISAISLNDRVLLINVLFKEDPLLFQSTISAFNEMTTLDEAIAYIQTNFPDWDLNSEPVYRLMMAVRRKIR